MSQAEQTVAATTLAAETLAELLGQGGAGRRACLLADASQVLHLYHMFDGWGMAPACLFDGAAAEEFVDDAPYLVALDRIPPMAEDFIWSVLTDGHGMILFSQADRAAVRAHLRRFTRMRLDGSGTVFVKFATARNFIYILETVPGFARLFDVVDSAVMTDMGLDRSFVAFHRKEAG